MAKFTSPEAMTPTENERTNMTSNNERAIELFAAASKGATELITAQTEIASAIVGQDVIEKDEGCRTSRSFEYRDLTDFEATTEMAKALAAQNNDNSSRYDLRTCNESTFVALWTARQMIDKTGIPYPIYVSEAVQWLQKNGKKRIRPQMLMTSDVLLHVMERYDAEVLACRRANADVDATSGNSDDTGSTEE